MTRTASSRTGLAWAAVALGGVTAAAVLVSQGRPGRLPDDAVAVVGTQTIGRAQWLRAVEAVETDRGAALDAAGRQRILQRLIDEELLFQHALDSGLARDDPGLRKTLVAAVIDAATAGNRVDEAATRALFERDPAYFSAQPRLRVSAVHAPPQTAHEHVLRALRDGAADPPLQRVELAQAPLPLAQLAQHLGGSAVEALRTAAPGAVVGPLPAGEDRELWLMLHERLADAPRYEDVAAAVRSEWARREAEAALERLLQTLRHATAIRVAEDLQ